MSEKKESFMEKVERENQERSTTCKGCKGTTEKNAKVCPHCGKKDPTGQNKAKIGMLFFAVLFAAIVVLLLVPEPEPELSESAQKAIKNATIERDAWGQTKVSYKVTIPFETIKQVKGDEIENFLKVLLERQNEKSSFERSFVAVYAPQMSSAFASLGYEREGNKISLMSDWCKVNGLDYLYKNTQVFYPKVIWLRSQVNILSKGFINEQRSNIDLKKYLQKSKNIREEWNSFILENTPKGCCVNYPGVYGKVKNLAFTILTSIEDSEKYFLQRQFLKDIESMNSYQL